MTKPSAVTRFVTARSISLALALSFVAQCQVAAPAAGDTTETAPATAAPATATPTTPDATAPATPTASPASALQALSAATDDDDNAVTPNVGGKVMWKPGQILSTDTDVEDIQPTDDISVATKQVQAYPDSPEASFIYAVNLTRTSRVEDALKEVRRARKLAEGKGGPAYFDKMIETYETMLKNFPNEDRVRYHLAWAYYMKAYAIAKYSKRSAIWKRANPELAAKIAAAQAAQTQGQAPAAVTSPAPTATPKTAVAAAPVSVPVNLGGDTSGLGKLLGAVAGLTNGSVSADKLRIPTPMEQCEPQDVPEVKKYYEMALQKLDEMLANKPHDVWAIVYRAHLKAEYTGDLADAMSTWTRCKKEYPNNPAAYFFLGEGYLKQGNLKESLNHVSKAVALRALGN